MDSANDQKAQAARIRRETILTGPDFGYVTTTEISVWFVIVAETDPEMIVDTFQAVQWEPAVTEYARRVRGGAYDRPVSLRQARSHEIDLIAKTTRDLTRQGPQTKPVVSGF